MQTQVLLDTMPITFGLKHLDLRGPHPKLNGNYLYLFGYGDDSIYPDVAAGDECGNPGTK